jgi:hypothetical protein
MNSNNLKQDWAWASGSSPLQSEFGQPLLSKHEVVRHSGFVLECLNLLQEHSYRASVLRRLALLQHPVERATLVKQELASVAPYVLDPEHIEAVAQLTRSIDDEIQVIMLYQREAAVWLARRKWQRTEAIIMQLHTSVSRLELFARLVTRPPSFS